MTAPNVTRKTEGGHPWRWLASQKEHGYALTLWLCSVLLFWRPLAALADLCFRDENSSHILLIPLISAFLVYLDRRRIFYDVRPSPVIGITLLLISIFLFYSPKGPLRSLNTTNLSIVAGLIVMAWIATFILCYGTGSFRSAAFPFLFLLLMIPLPNGVAEYVVSVLQKESAEISYLLFRLLRVPVLRHDFQFSLPGVNIEVGEQCSGIHSGLSLFIAGLLAARFALQNNWKRLFFVLCILPIAIFKNAVRIVTLACLGIYVNPSILQSRLHRQGGLPFSLLSLALMALLLWLLRRSWHLHPLRPVPPA